MKRIALLIVCCCLMLSSSAQYYTNQNKVWAFGNGACVDFNSGSPVAFPSSIYANEGTSSVCNSAGSLLFYSDGQKVYNRLGLITPGGGAVVPFTTWSSTQGSLIVPFFNDTNKYYVFSLESYGTSSGKLAYSIVDMTLDGGLGDVVAGSAGTIISTGMSEKMIAIPGNSCNIWLMVHRIDSPKFYAYEITSSGISTTPVISYEGTLLGTNSNEIGVIKCSHDRQKIVGIGHHIGTMWGVELFDFNPTTGIVSNCRVLEASPTANPYGAEFSPDNSKLYTSSYMQINQWDLSLPTTAAIIASKIKIDSSTSYYSDLRLAPDGKIYYQQYSTSSLARINFPNLPGAMCGMATSVVSLSPGTGMLGFPNLVWRVQAILDTATVCAGATITLTPTGSGGTWSSSDPTVATVTASGVVTGVSVGTANIFYTTGPGCPETTFITVTPGGTIIGKTTLCEGFSTMLSCGTTGGYWSSSSPNATVSPSGLVTGVSAGTAIISYVVPGPCIPTAIMTINPMPAPIVGPTTVIAGSTITLTNATAGGSWTSSDSARALPDPTGVITGVTPGTATIYYIFPTGCKQSVVINVTSKNTTAIGSIQSTRPMLYPNPATSEISVIADPSAFTSFDIYNAVGQVIATQEITGSQTVVNVKAYPPGEYQVVFKGNAAREVIRFTKW